MSSDSQRYFVIPLCIALSLGIGYLCGLKARGQTILSKESPGEGGGGESVEESLRKSNDFLTAERAGRVRAERALREVVNKAVTSASGGGYPLLPIGKIRSPFRGRWGTPRQGMLAPHTRAHIDTGHSPVSMPRRAQKSTTVPDPHPPHLW